MNINASIVATIKEKLAEARANVAKYEAALEAFGFNLNGTTAPKAKAKRVSRGRKPVAAIQAAGDARAVKAGNATPEQYQRWHERQNAKAAKAAKATPEAEETVSGANLAAAAS